jgi:hypothetical protein
LKSTLKTEVVVNRLNLWTVSQLLETGKHLVSTRKSLEISSYSGTDPASVIMSASLLKDSGSPRLKLHIKAMFTVKEFTLLIKLA